MIFLSPYGTNTHIPYKLLKKGIFSGSRNVFKYSNIFVPLLWWITKGCMISVIIYFVNSVQKNDGITLLQFQWIYPSFSLSDGELLKRTQTFSKLRMYYEYDSRFSISSSNLLDLCFHLKNPFSQQSVGNTHTQRKRSEIQTKAFFRVNARFLCATDSFSVLLPFLPNRAHKDIPILEEKQFTLLLDDSKHSRKYVCNFFLFLQQRNGTKQLLQFNSWKRIE